LSGKQTKTSGQSSC